MVYIGQEKNTKDKNENMKFRAKICSTFCNQHDLYHQQSPDF